MTTSIEDLSQLLGVSESTTRRDLVALSEAGELVRVLGGAAPKARTEYSWQQKADAHASEKRAIAQFVADHLVRPGDVVFIDSGTTPAAVARALADRDDITLIVAGLAALLEVSESAAKVLVLGGRLRRPSASFLGEGALLMLDLITPDVAFLGTDFVDPTHGANYHDLEQAVFKTRVMRESLRSWLVVDHTKLDGEPPFSMWAPLSSSTGIVTVAAPHDRVQPRIDALREKGHEVHVCPRSV